MGEPNHPLVRLPFHRYGLFDPPIVDALIQRESRRERERESILYCNLGDIKYSKNSSSLNLYGQCVSTDEMSYRSRSIIFQIYFLNKI